MRLIHQETMAEKVDFNPTSVFTDLPPICPELGLSKKIFSKWENKNKKHTYFFFFIMYYILVWANTVLTLIFIQNQYFFTLLLQGSFGKRCFYKEGSV